MLLSILSCCDTMVVSILPHTLMVAIDVLLCRWCGVFNQRTSNIVQDDFTHCKLLHSAIVTDYLSLVNLMCKYEEDRKAKQRR